MSKRPFLRRLRDISIAKKLYFAVGIMAMLIAIELFTLWFAITTLSSVRAFVGGEGLWSKNEKDAVYHLRKYDRTRLDNEYLRFQNFMKVPLGDHKTRLELLKKEPDMEVARQGFLEGRNHEKDIDGMIKLFRRFHNISYIDKAIRIWSAADSVISALVPLGEQMHAEINQPEPSQERIDDLLKQIDDINEKLTVLEDEFSFTLGEGSRWLENLILKLLFAVALTVETSGLLLTISVSRGIQKGLNEIIRVSKRIAKGDFKAKAKAYSADEIGILATAFNQMADELGHASDSLKNYAAKLEQSNENLRQFAYIASHDLKEPLRKINTFSSRLQEEYDHSIDGTGQTYLHKIENAATRMQKLIDDILNFSRLNSEEVTFEKTDLNAIIKEVLTDMEVVIAKNEAQVKVDLLPTVDANDTQMRQLFQNLISNCLKFRKPDSNPVIEIKSSVIYGSVSHNGNSTKNHSAFVENGSDHNSAMKYCKITVSDNGIGFNQAYAEKIFVAFQRLSSRYEGTGIGLAICKRIIENHKGIIFSESELGKGATFTIILPFRQQQQMSLITQREKENAN